MYIPFLDDYSSRMDKVALPFNDLQTKVRKPLEGYRDTPITLGDKIRNRRLELQLFQKETAPLIGVTESGLVYWERNIYQPQVHLYPKVIEFLGYFPFEIDTSTLGGKLNEYRFRNGLSQKNLGKLLGVDGTTICDWERGITKPKGEYLNKLQELLK